MPEAEPLVLPFAVIEREGAAAHEFPLEMTLATILADVEMQREKAGFLRKREEGLEFASLLYWPIIIAPWREGRHLVFDGMGVWSYVFSKGRIPDAASFTKAIQAAKDYKTFLGLLNERAAYFDAFAEVDREALIGLFIHEEFMKDVLSHLALAKPKQLRGNPVLTPRLTVPQVQDGVRRMAAMVDAMGKDLDVLGTTRQALEGALDGARKDVAKVRDKVVSDHNRKIESIRPDVNKRVAALEAEREERWAAMQPKLIDLQASVRTAEADVAHWDAEARRKDNPYVATAKERRSAARDGWARAQEQAGAYQQEMAQARANYDRQIQAQWERIREIERARDAEVARLNQEEQALVALVGKLSLGIAGLGRQLEETMRFMQGQGVQAVVEAATLVRMPIMVASLATDRGRRFVVYPPMVARAGKGVLGSLKTTFGGAVLPLEPKTEQFEEIFRAGIEKAVVDDPSLSGYLASVGNANNLLHLANLRQMLGKGLQDMKAQGWIKDKHERELIVNLERHIAAAARTAPKAE